MPAGSDEVVIARAALIVIDRPWVALPPPLSVNRTMKLAVPAVDGVPLMTPEDAARFKPCGNAPCEMLQVTGATAPDTLRVAEYDEPVVPLGNAAVVMSGLEMTVMLRSCSCRGVGSGSVMMRTVSPTASPCRWPAIA